MLHAAWYSADVLMCTWEAACSLVVCNVAQVASQLRTIGFMRGRPMQRRHVGRHRLACATNSDCAQTSMSFAQKEHSTTMLETRAPHDCDLRTGPKPWPVTECTGSVDALPLQSDAIGGSRPFPHRGSDAGCNFGTLLFNWH